MFADRRDAGQRLAAKLLSFAARDPVVLALPRGGLPVAYEVALALDAPLDIVVVRKLGVPGHEELAFGAVASGGIRVLNEDVVRHLRLSTETINEVTREELAEVGRRESAYRESQSAIDVHGRTVILVDDGLATGATMRAAVRALKKISPYVVVAVPVGSEASCRELRREADEVVCSAEPQTFYAVGQWYSRFDQTTDEEVRSLLKEAREAGGPQDEHVTR